MKPHPDKEVMDGLFPAVRKYQELATKHGIGDIFQDNGGKLLQLILLTGLKVIGSREGNDAKDAAGREYELKSVNVLLTRNFSTHHHMNPQIIAKYRKVAGWYFATYEGIELQEVYLVKPDQLEPFFQKWEKKWRTEKKDINNPKIPLSFVAERGKRVFKAEKKPAAVLPPRPPFNVERAEGKK